MIFLYCKIYNVLFSMHSFVVGFSSYSQVPREFTVYQPSTSYLPTYLSTYVI